MSNPTRMSVLDLGSNSFHVLVADIDADGAIQPMGREREMLHLGAEVEATGRISDSTRTRAVGVVAHLTELAGRLGASQRLAVATSALRDARNAPEVLAAMEQAANTSITVLSGRQEAALAFAGVRASVGRADERIMVLDLGGGSLELAAGDDLTPDWSTSLDLGVSRLSATVKYDPLRPKDVKRLARLVHEHVDPVADEARGVGASGIYCVGGTIRAIGRIVAEANGEWLPATLNESRFRTRDVASLADELAGMDAAARANVPGMKQKRADRLHIAAIVLSTTLEALDIEKFTLSDWGLREGVLLDAMGVDRAMTQTELRHREVGRLQQMFTPNDAHLGHVADLTIQLFDQTRELHGMSDGDRELLWCATSLHDVGETLALRGHHKHGAYIIEHAEMRGFSPRETALLASVVRFHKSRGLNRSFPPFASLSNKWQGKAERMVALLQLADGLDRARDQAVRSVDVDLADGVARLSLHGDELHVAREEVDRKTELFERVFDRRVRLSD